MPNRSTMLSFRHAYMLVQTQINLYVYMGERTWKRVRERARAVCVHLATICSIAMQPPSTLYALFYSYCCHRFTCSSRLLHLGFLPLRVYLCGCISMFISIYSSLCRIFLLSLPAFRRLSTAYVCSCMCVVHTHMLISSISIDNKNKSKMQGIDATLQVVVAARSQWTSCKQASSIENLCICIFLPNFFAQVRSILFRLQFFLRNCNIG